MKSLGITRKIDELGRVVIPKETRDIMGLDIKEPVAFYMEGDDTLIIKKFNPGCVFCGEMNELTDYKDKKVCKKCAKDLNKKAK